MASCSSNDNNPPLCAKSCGFYGNPETNNMCSKCYKGFLNLSEERLRLLTITGKPLKLKTTTTSASDHNDDHTTSNDNKKKRCDSCKKRVGLTGFECRCRGLFCGLHRYPEEHGCLFDFKTLGRLQLEKQNNLCVSDKLLERA